MGIIIIGTSLFLECNHHFNKTKSCLSENNYYQLIYTVEPAILQIGAQSVLIIEVSLFQSVLIIEVSLFQSVLIIEVSLFQSVLIIE